MAEAVSYFAVKSIGMSKVNGRKPCSLLNAARHNLREIQAEHGAPGRIDVARMHHNIVLHGPAVAADVQAQAVALLGAAGIDPDKMRRDHCQAIEAVFSLPRVSPVHDPDAYFARCLVWLAGALPLPIISAVVHRDESELHLHVLLLPLVAGVHAGGAPINREAVKRLQEGFFEKVAGPAGLKRAGAKLYGMAKQRAVAAVLRRCEAQGLPAAIGALWAVLEAAIHRDPLPALLALGMDANNLPTMECAPVLEATQNPIGIDQNPIGIEKGGEKHRSLSCVGIAPPPPPNQPPFRAPPLPPEPGLPAPEPVVVAPCPAAPTAAPAQPPLPAPAPAPVPAVAAPVEPALPPQPLAQDTDHDRDDQRGTECHVRLDPEIHQVVVPTQRGTECHVQPDPDPDHDGITRERDSDRHAFQWSEELGEFVPVPQARSSNRPRADLWVREQLDALRAPSMPQPILVTARAAPF